MWQRQICWWGTQDKMEKIWPLTFLTPLKNQNQIHQSTTPFAYSLTNCKADFPSSKQKVGLPDTRLVTLARCWLRPPDQQHRESLNKAEFHLVSRISNNVECKKIVLNSLFPLLCFHISLVKHNIKDRNFDWTWKNV